MPKVFSVDVVLSLLYDGFLGQTKYSDVEELANYLEVPYLKTAYDPDHMFNRERDFLWEQFPQYRGLNPDALISNFTYLQRSLAFGTRVNVMSYAEFYPERVIVSYAAVPYDQIKDGNYFIGVNLTYSKDMLVGGAMREWLDAQKNKVFRLESMYSGLAVVVLSELDRSWITDWNGFVSPTVEVQIAFVRNFSIYQLQKVVKQYVPA